MQSNQEIITRFVRKYAHLFTPSEGHEFIEELRFLMNCYAAEALRVDFIPDMQMQQGEVRPVPALFSESLKAPAKPTKKTAKAKKARLN